MTLTKDDMVRVMSVLAAAFPDKSLSAQTIALYHGCLADLPAQAVETAALDWIMHGRPWFPKIAELRESATELAPGGPPPAAEQAFQSILETEQSNGRSVWYTPGSVFLTKVWIAAGGERYGAEPAPGRGAIRAAFVRLYPQMLGQERRAGFMRAGVDIKTLLQRGGIPLLTTSTEGDKKE